MFGKASLNIFYVNMIVRAIELLYIREGKEIQVKITSCYSSPPLHFSHIKKTKKKDKTRSTWINNIISAHIGSQLSVYAMNSLTATRCLELGAMIT